jgi:hypothetical protein
MKFLAALLAMMGVALVAETAWYVPSMNTDLAIIAVICGLGAVACACLVLFD